MSDQDTPGRLPFKIVDYSREKKFGIVAGSLEELVSKGTILHEINSLLFGKINLVLLKTDLFCLQHVKNWKWIRMLW